jgi:hypothetical protein
MEEEEDSMSKDEELAAIARAIIDDNRFMTLGTADENGLPWVSPVWYAAGHAAYREFLWVSDPAARHSRNLLVRPDVSIVIFDSRARTGSAQAVYMSAAAKALTDAELEQDIDSFSASSRAQGAPDWEVVDDRGGVAPVRDDAHHGPPRFPLNLYRAVVSEHFVLDPSAAGDRRVRVSF